MSKRTLKDIERDAAALERAFEKLDDDKCRLADFEVKVMEDYSDVTSPLRQLEYELENRDDAADLSHFLADAKHSERQIGAFFLEREEQLKKQKWQLEEAADKVASEKKKFYMEEDDGH